ncbi:nitroreductase [Pseudomonas sp. NPDC090202]|uniref:nitroreductase n=1 Tax=unclassified Pseudomonas TaxID=196821 RepID=UPI00380A76C8
MFSTPYIDELIRGRTSKRSFTDTPVSIETVREIISVARHAPSASNSQPWRCFILTGQALKRITDGAVAAYQNNPLELAPEYPFFPNEVHEPYARRTTSFREQLGEAQSCNRADKEKRRLNIEHQFRFFDAPVGLIFTMDRRLEWSSFICYGCFLQNIMLAAKGRGLDTCPQQIWSLQHAFLRQALKLGEEDMVVAGMSLGWADNAREVNRMTVPRMPLDEFVTFLE